MKDRTHNNKAARCISVAGMLIASGCATQKIYIPPGTENVRITQPSAYWKSNAGNDGDAAVHATTSPNTEIPMPLGAEKEK